MEKTIITLNGHDAKAKNTLTLVSFDKKQVKYKLVTPFSNALRCGISPDNPEADAMTEAVLKFMPLRGYRNFGGITNEAIEKVVEDLKKLTGQE